MFPKLLTKKYFLDGFSSFTNNVTQEDYVIGESLKQKGLIKGLKLLFYVSVNPDMTLLEKDFKTEFYRTRKLMTISEEDLKVKFYNENALEWIYYSE